MGVSVEFGPSRYSPKRSWGAREEVVGACRDPPEEKGVQTVRRNTGSPVVIAEIVSCLAKDGP